MCERTHPLYTDSPQLALNLGHYLKHCTLLKVSLDIQAECKNMQKEELFRTFLRPFFIETTGCREL